MGARAPVPAGRRTLAEAHGPPPEEAHDPPPALPALRPPGHRVQAGRLPARPSQAVLRPEVRRGSQAVPRPEVPRPEARRGSQAAGPAEHGQDASGEGRVNLV